MVTATLTFRPRIDNATVRWHLVERDVRCDSEQQPRVTVRTIRPASIVIEMTGRDQDVRLLLGGGRFCQYFKVDGAPLVEKLRDPHLGLDARSLVQALASLLADAPQLREAVNAV